MTHRVAVIGAGPEPDEQRAGTGFSMGYRHANAYRALENCELVAVADLVSENAEAFADEFGIDDDGVFENHETMLETATPDVVSIAVPPGGHAPLTIDCARAGVEAIHCEKPMADTWGASRRMAQECWRRDVQLTFNHQLRFHDVTTRAKELLDGGEIGNLERIEISRKNLYDAGTHQVDLATYFASDVAPEWVIGQVDYSEENVFYGVPNDTQALAQWRYENGVYAMGATGPGADGVGASVRLVGSDGRIEVTFWDPELTIDRADGGTETLAFESHDPLARAVEHAVESLEDGTEPLLSARRALNTTEIIFATYESARKRGRVECPLDVDDNPLTAMIENGEIGPAGDD